MKLGPIQKQWIAALRSGKYKQGKSFLEAPDGDAFCCLGVACKATDHGEDLILTSNGDYIMGFTLADQEASVYEALGLRDGAGEPSLEPAERLDELKEYLIDKRPDLGADIENSWSSDLQLIDLNDTLELTFDQVADLLETFPDLYFEESK